jgi:hypothetical protein
MEILSIVAGKLFGIKRQGRRKNPPPNENGRIK